MNFITPKSVGKHEATMEKVKTLEPLKIGSADFVLEPDPLSSEMAEKAKNELNETVNVVQKGLADMRELLKGK